MKRPLAIFALGFWAALFVGGQLLGGRFMPVLGGILCAAGAGAALWLRARKRAGRAAAGRGILALLLLAAGLALVWQGVYQEAFVRPVAALGGQNRAVRGRVEAVAPDYDADSEVLTLRVLALDGQQLSRTFLVELRAEAGWAPGDVAEAPMTFYDLGGDGAARRRHTQGLFVGAKADEPPQKSGEAPTALTEMRRLQYRMGDNIREKLPPRLGGVAAAMTVGDGRFVPAASEAYRKAGLSHLLVVSGLHLSVLTGVLYRLLAHSARRRKLAAGCCMAFVVLFMALTGLRPSIVRSGFAYLLVFAGPLANRKADIYTSLGAALLALCAANPFAALDAGLLLSFAATLGALQAGHWQQRLAARRQGKPAPGAARRAAGRVAEAALVPLAVTGATLPVLIWMDGGISLFAVPMNLLAVPLLTPVMLAGFGMALPGGGWPFALLGRAAALVGGTLLAFLEWLTGLCANLPLGNLPVGGFVGLVAVVAVYALLWLGARQGRLKQAAAGALAVVLLAAALAAGLGHDVVVFEVAGGANASLVVVRGGEACVLYRSRASLWAVRQALWRHRVTKVRLLVDLRRSTEGTEYEQLAPERVVVAREDVLARRQFDALAGVAVYVVNGPRGSFGCAEAEGYRVGLAAGSINLGAYPALDALVDGPGDVQAERARTLESGQIVLRPGAGVRYREVSDGQQS